MSTSPAPLAVPRGRPTPSGPRLAVVPRPDRAPRVPFVVLVTLLLLGGVVGLLLFNTQMQQASFAATALERQATTLAAREQTLVRELESLRNPQRLAEAAQAQGLVIPGNSCTLSLADGGATGGCTAATRESTPRLQEPPPAKPKALVPTTQGSGNETRHRPEVRRSGRAAG